jgi:predicted AAA+ superfamily ATPase
VRAEMLDFSDSLEYTPEISIVIRSVFMIEDFRRILYGLLQDVKIKPYRRYLYPALNLKNRLLGIVGPRGVGKTTLMLQYILSNFPSIKAQVLYFSADHIYFTNNTLVKFVQDAHFEEKIEYFFIDEIHKYKNWNQELKNIYDSYPNVKIMFSGSSSIDLIKGTYDLSRRAILKHLAGLSFREYLNFTTNAHYEPINAKDILAHYREFDKDFLGIEQLKDHFNHYLEQGYYPFVLAKEESYYERINQIVDKTIYEDIANFYKLKTENLHFLKRIIGYLSTIPPGEVNTNNLANYLAIDNKTAFHYLHILSEAGLVRLIYPKATGNQMLRKVEKIFLNNTTLQHAINSQVAGSIEKGTIRELFFIQSLQDAGVDVFYNKRGDFLALDIVFEIGGKNKNKQQIKENGLLVKDDILMSAQGVIPLYYWGFCY